MTSLFEPLQLGALHLPNRIVMAPLTRMRADPQGVPIALMQRYYAQRAQAGLILTEATVVHPSGVGYPGTPGIWTDAQMRGWRSVVQAVHDAGGRIAMQLWHVGRISHPDVLGGAQPVAPSALAAKGAVSVMRPKRDYVVPRALEESEILEIIAAFGHGAAQAREAGFDGVEIHGANGYLLDQFLQDSSNQRTDAWGGSMANRCRMHLAVTDAVVQAWSADRVGMHLAPRCDAHTMGDTNPPALFTHLVRELDQRKLAYIFTRDSKKAPQLSAQLRPLFHGAWIANEAYDFAMAQAALETGECDAVAFGKAYIANPDLVQRLRTGAPLNAPVPETFYGPLVPSPEVGYTDYPTLDQATA
jgi:2,4-dienoyl-CoA reductase-like NADH-dependent reductase (Old Yellow Enzyme family)